MLDRIARGELKAVETTPQTRCRIDRSFKTEDGWTFEIFDDCGGMDYLNWAQTPRGQRCASWVRKGSRWDDPMLHMKEPDTKLAAALRWDGNGDYIPYYIVQDTHKATCSVAENTMITAAQFKALTGRKPQDDDLERINCDKALQPFHMSCGVCPTCNQPAWLCLHWQERTRAAFDVRVEGERLVDLEGSPVSMAGSEFLRNDRKEMIDRRENPALTFWSSLAAEYAGLEGGAAAMFKYFNEPYAPRRYWRPWYARLWSWVRRA